MTPDDASAYEKILKKRRPQGVVRLANTIERMGSG